MTRAQRVTIGGIPYHVLNRANARETIFSEGTDYRGFLRVLNEATERTQMRLLAYCVMPNHFHRVLWPRRDGELGRFMQWLTLTHTARWQVFHGFAGHGHLYQGRYKSFPIQEDHHLLEVFRYVEANPLRAGLGSRAEDWGWSSLAQRLGGEGDVLVTNSPAELPFDWKGYVNGRESPGVLAALRKSAAYGTAYGEARWAEELKGVRTRRGS
jgi:putative transposase